MWVISWGHSSQISELSVGLCLLKSENCEFSFSVLHVGVFLISLSMPFMPMFHFVSFIKCTVFVLCGLSECFVRAGILFVLYLNLLLLDTFLKSLLI